jgi:hypothetical protein
MKGRVVPYEREQEVIRSIFEMHSDALSNGAIARVLSAMKVPTKQRRIKWHSELVRQILIRSDECSPLSISDIIGYNRI